MRLELGIPNSELFLCFRRRRYKRMAIDASDSPPELGDVVLFKEPHPHQPHNILSAPFGDPISPRPLVPVTSGMSGPSSSSNTPSPSTSTKVKKSSRKKSVPLNPFLPFDVEAGKRKRGHRDKSVEAGLATEFDSMIGMGIELMNIDKEGDEEMKSGEDGTSSSSDSESVVGASCDEGQEGKSLLILYIPHSVILSLLKNINNIGMA